MELVKDAFEFCHLKLKSRRNMLSRLFRKYCKNKGRVTAESGFERLGIVKTFSISLAFRYLQLVDYQPSQQKPENNS